jgi:hypothetical protein
VSACHTIFKPRKKTTLAAARFIGIRRRSEQASDLAVGTDVD